MKETKSKGLIIILIVFIILFLGTALVLGYGYFKYNDLQKNFVDLQKKYDDTNTNLENTNNELTKAKTDLDASKKVENGLKQGYIPVKFLDKDTDYKIYDIEFYGGGLHYIIVSYKDELYQVNVSGEDAASVIYTAIDKISKAKFDSDNNYEVKIDGVFVAMHKFSGKASELTKVTANIPYNSSDGSNVPILIYKSGEVESTISNISKALKDYKVKDVLSQKCLKPEGNGFECKKGKIAYKVVLQDGTEKEINY